MKTFRPVAVILFIITFMTVSVFAQSSRVAVIDTGAFGEKGGITKYATARDTLQKEFEPVNAELRTMGTRYENLRKEIEGLQKQPSTPPATLQAKADEYYKLERDIKFKQEDAKARSQSRYNTVMGPVLEDIGKAIQAYAKQKGYTMIFDASKLAAAGLILGIGDGSVDVTKDFITFYNTRPAGAATTTTPPK
jgi:Skp family chaperone for outer membrane proteins